MASWKRQRSGPSRSGMKKRRSLNTISYVAEEVARLKQQPGQGILIYGSGQLVDSLMQHGLIDEYRLMVYPLVMGSGKRLFRNAHDTTELSLVESQAFSTGVVVLTYQPAAKKAER